MALVCDLLRQVQLKRRVMSVWVQNEKASQRAFLDRCTPESGRSFERRERQLRAITRRWQVRHTIPGCSLLDHLVGDGEQLVRDVEAERLDGRKVDNELEFDRLQYRQV